MNPKMRKYMRKAKKLASMAEEGEKVMCPCGCMSMFVKSTKSQCFNSSEGNKHKDRYYNTVRKSTNPPLYAETHEKIKRLGRYVKMKEQALALDKKEERKKEIDKITDKINIIYKNPIKESFTPESFIEVMKQTKEISKLSPPKSTVLCPCGCGETFTKTTKDNTYNRIEGNKHKDDYYSKIRGEIKVENNEQTLLAFNKMKRFIAERSKKLKNLQSIKKQKMK